jgi:putative lipoprotein
MKTLRHPNSSRYHKTLLFTLMITPLITLSAWANDSSPPSRSNTDMKTLNTTVFYRERMMLPPGSIVTVILADVTRMDAKSKILNKGEIEATTTPPYKIPLQYDPNAIQERMSYSLRATIKNGGKLLFTSTTSLDPFKQQTHDEIEILVQKVSGSKAAAKANSSLTDTYWKADTLKGKNIDLGIDGKELSMILESSQNRVHGFSGCNNFSGFFFLQGENLRFEKMISTQKMCIKGMEQEISFLQTLMTSDRFKIQGKALLIFDKSGNNTARFVARHMQ